MQARLIVSAAVGLLSVGAQGAQAQVIPVALVEKAIGKSVPLMQSSAKTIEARMGKLCFSCHHQSVPSLAYAKVAARGFNVGAQGRVQQSDFVYSYAAKLKPYFERAVRNNDADAAREIDKRTVDPSVTLGYLLFGLDQDGRAPDELLRQGTQYLARKQTEDGRWPAYGARPPMEGSEFATTAMAVRSINTYGAAEFAAENQERIARAREWLVRTRPRSTEDRAFRLLGLKWSGADESVIKAATREILDEQRDDGGWSQLPGKGSDAYATGQIVVALNEAAGLGATDSAFTRAAFYLLFTQQPDGSWRVIKRTAAAQPYFESGFPHGKDQFISIAGPGWATAALALALPETQTTARR